MKIKKFNQFIEDKVVLESLFQEWKETANLEDLIKSLNESYLEEGLEDLEDEDRELTSGEKAALARDFQILTDAQLAAMYLRAKEKAEEEDGKYTNMIHGIEGFIDKDKEGAFSISAAALADAIGVESARTVQRTISKFKNLINGVGETSGESLYPKIKKIFDIFSSTKDSDLANLASEAIQDVSVTTARDAHAAQGERAKELSVARKENNVKLGEKVYSLVNALRGPFGLTKAQNSAISKIAKELDLDPEYIKKAYKEYLKDKNLLSDYVN